MFTIKGIIICFFKIETHLDFGRLFWVWWALPTLLGDETFFNIGLFFYHRDAESAERGGMNHKGHKGHKGRINQGVSLRERVHLHGQDLFQNLRRLLLLYLRAIDDLLRRVGQI